MTEGSEIREFLEKVDGTVEQVVSYIELLDKVKHLLTIPGTDTMTTRQVADYYGIEIDTVRRVYQRHKDEIDLDGTVVKKAADFLTKPEVQVKDADKLTGRKVTLGGCDVCTEQTVQVKNSIRGSSLIDFGDGVVITISNHGTRVFSHRAILRIGMLMPGSKVATEVRTQLLNVFEKVPTATVVEPIDNERKLRKRVGDSIIAGRFAEAADYISQLTEYLERNNKDIHAA